MDTLEIESDRVEYLRSRVAAAYQNNQDISELGDLALEIMVMRNELENHKDKRVEAEKLLETIKEIEKSLISLYLMDKMKNSEMKKYFSLPREYSVFVR